MDSTPRVLSMKKYVHKTLKLCKKGHLFKTMLNNFIEKLYAQLRKHNKAIHKTRPTSSS